MLASARSGPWRKTRPPRLFGPCRGTGVDHRRANLPPRAVQPRLDRADGQAGAQRDLWGRTALDVARDEHFAIERRQALERALEAGCESLTLDPPPKLLPMLRSTRRPLTYWVGSPL